METNTETTPRSISDCKGSPNWVQWQNAIKSELNSLISKHVFEGPMELPADKQCIGNRWVFTVKRMEDGSIAKYKARLVAQGFSQRPGFDYNETYSPVIDMISYRYIKSDMTKHLSPKFYFTTDMVNMGRIKVVQIPTIDNLADIFTKSLPGPRHQELRRKLGMMSLYHCLRGLMY